MPERRKTPRKVTPAQPPVPGLMFSSPPGAATAEAAAPSAVEAGATRPASSASSAEAETEEAMRRFGAAPAEAAASPAVEMVHEDEEEADAKVDLPTEDVPGMRDHEMPETAGDGSSPRRSSAVRPAPKAFVVRRRVVGHAGVGSGMPAPLHVHAVLYAASGSTAHQDFDDGIECVALLLEHRGNSQAPSILLIEDQLSEVHRGRS